MKSLLERKRNCNCARKTFSLNVEELPRPMIHKEESRKQKQGDQERGRPRLLYDGQMKRTTARGVEMTRRLALALV